MKVEILYEDNDILVVLKPAGLATQTAGIGQQDAVSQLKNHLRKTGRAAVGNAVGKAADGAAGNSVGKASEGTVGNSVGKAAERAVGNSVVKAADGAVGNSVGKAAERAVGNVPVKSPGQMLPPYLGVVHRLDQPVEGLLVFAKNKRAAADLTAQLQKQGDSGSLHKQYYAVLCGQPVEKEGELVDYLYKNQENTAVIVKPSELQHHAGAKKAVLRYQILQTISVVEPAAVEPAALATAATSMPRPQPSNISLIALAQIHIRTGRFHQIRAQMAHAGTPLLGDVKYGNEQSKAMAQALGIPAVALCACSLEFLHPVTKKKMNFQIKPVGKAFSFFSQT